MPDAIRRLVGRTGADPEALASAAAEASVKGHGLSGGVAAVASGRGVLLLVMRPSEGGVGERGLAHEMANALTAISGWARLVREAPDGARRARVAALEVAIADALETAGAFLAGPAAPVREHDLAQLVRRTATGMEPYAHDRGVRIELDASGSFTVERAAVAVRSIVQNLLKNAIEASPRGASVEVVLERSRRGLRVGVLDRGPGLGGPRRADGHGLGLGLVERLAKENGAVVRWQPRAGGGTEAWLQFRNESSQLPATGGRARSATPARPLRARSATPAPRPSAPVKRSGERMRRRHILLVEDEPALAEMVRSALAMIDAEVTSVASSAELLELGDGLRFEVALVDLRLEHGDPGTGLAVLSQIIERNLAARVVLTSGAPPEALPDGVDMILPKPFDLDGLLAALSPASPAALRTRSGGGL